MVKIIVHNAISLDGRIDGFPLDVGLYYQLIQTWSEDCTLVGSGTMLKPGQEEKPETERDLQPHVVDPDDPRPVLAIVDSEGKVRNWHTMKQWGGWKDYVALISESTPDDYLDYLGKRHIKHIRAGAEKVDLKEALDRLVQEFNIETIRVDSGGGLNGALLRLGLVSEVSILLHPVLAGGDPSSTVYKCLNAQPHDIQLQLKHFEKMQNGVLWLRYNVI